MEKQAIKRRIQSAKETKRVAGQFPNSNICLSTGIRYGTPHSNSEKQWFYDDVEIGVFIREIGDNKWKISTRTNNYIDLSIFAGTFGGGGHKNASGFLFDGKLEDLRNKIIENLKK